MKVLVITEIGVLIHVLATAYKLVHPDGGGSVRVRCYVIWLFSSVFFFRVYLRVQ